MPRHVLSGRLLALVVLSPLVALVLLDASQAQTAKKPAAKGWGKEITNSIGMKLVRIPKGTFTMGSPASEKHRGTDEQQHEVEITKDFWLGIHEVTQKQFKTVMGYNPSCFSSDGTGRPGVTYGAWKPAESKDKVAGQDANVFPVENVSWDEAKEFCEKLSAQPAEKRSGRLYRLPTEAEREYACRAGTKTVFHFGNSLSSKQANFDGDKPYGAEEGPRLGRTCKVGSYKPNAWGLHDMHGNVWEWCADWYDEDYYGKSPRRDPQGPGSGSFRVSRGGCWQFHGQYCRSAFRTGVVPEGRNEGVGFRVALVPAGRR
jgi:formylglycine-generating enzyme required for sulfatase activity